MSEEKCIDPTSRTDRSHHNNTGPILQLSKINIREYRTGH